MTMKRLFLASVLLSLILLAAKPAHAALYFPHVDTTAPWQTEIAIINTSPTQAVSGTLRAFSNSGEAIETKTIELPAHGRRQITIAAEFTNHARIGYLIFDTASDTVQGYTKFSRQGQDGVAIPAVTEIPASDIIIPHIDSGADWWTGLSLVNTTAAPKALEFVFSTGQRRNITLNPHEHQAFTVESLVSDQPRTDIASAVITNASGIIGLALFGTRNNRQLEGIILSDKTASTLYYPHVAGDGWWTGIVAYNPSWQDCYITITPYKADGTALLASTSLLAAKAKYVGTVSQLRLPAGTAGFQIDATSPLSGFELFGAADGTQLAAYAATGDTGEKTGVFAKIEKNGWTGIAFVNTETNGALVFLTAYNDSGTPVGSNSLWLNGHAKVVSLAEALFAQDISSATYIAYSADRKIVGLQLNGSADLAMLDGLPGFAGPAPVSSPGLTQSEEQTIRQAVEGAVWEVFSALGGGITARRNIGTAAAETDAILGRLISTPFNYPNIPCAVSGRRITDGNIKVNTETCDITGLYKTVFSQSDLYACEVAPNLFIFGIIFVSVTGNANGAVTLQYSGLLNVERKGVIGFVPVSSDYGLSGSLVIRGAAMLAFLGTWGGPAICVPAPGAFQLTATAGCDGTTSGIWLAWTRPGYSDTYDIYRNGGLFRSGLTAAQYTDTEVIPGAAYTYYVQAKNATGSINSNTAQATAETCDHPLPSCSYTLNPTSQSFNAAGGSGSVTVTTLSACTWTAVSNAAWVAVTAGNAGTGTGTVKYAVETNVGPNQRTGTITIAGQSFTVIQAGTGGGGSSYAGTLTGTWCGTCWYSQYSSSVSGIFSLKIDANGAVTGSYSGSDSGTITGTVSTTGSYSAGSAGTISWSGTISRSGTSLSGDGIWQGIIDDFTCSGDWSGTGSSTTSGLAFDFPASQRAPGNLPFPDLVRAPKGDPP
jgi:hypothetical protein